MKYLFKIFQIFALVHIYKIYCFSPSMMINNTNSFNDEISDYYWREYTGVIPGDAIPGGIDTAGDATYIGQMYVSKFGLLPATIRPGSINVMSSGGGTSFTADKFVKILCSRNLYKYKWIVTKNEETHLLTTCHMVVGGTEAGFVLNIGRVHHELETVIGKVFAHHTPYRGLSIPYGKKEATYQSYEILTYDCNISDSHYYNNVSQVDKIIIY